MSSPPWVVCTTCARWPSASIWLATALAACSPRSAANCRVNPGLVTGGVGGVVVVSRGGAAMFSGGGALVSGDGVAAEGSSVLTEADNGQSRHIPRHVSTAYLQAWR